MSRLTVQGALELAVREHQSGRLDDAMALYQHVLGVEPRNADALHLSGMVELARGRVAEAIGLMERALAGTGVKSPPHYRSNLANAYREAGELERAEAEYRAAIAAGGGTPEVFNNLGLTLVSLGRPAWAIEQFELSLARRPRHAGTWINLSVACLAGGAAAEALRCADEALGIEPGSSPAFLARAAALAALDRRDEAETIYSGLMKTSIAPAAIRGYSDLLLARGAATEAMSASLDVTERFAADVTAWAQHGTNLARAARLEEAERALARACEIAPGNAAVRAQHGAMLLTLGRVADATLELRRAIELDRGNAQAWGNLSTALVRGGDFAGAVEAAEQGVRWSERGPGALAVLGAALLAARRFVEAEAIFRELIRGVPSADAWNGLGVALERLGRIEDAKRAYASAIEIEPGHVVARLNHAETLLLTGDFATGWEAYEARFSYLRELGGANEAVESAPQWTRGALRSDGGLPRVLIVGEQGLGDAIQFARYASLVRREVARVIVRSPLAACELLATARGVDEVIGPTEPAPPHDYVIHAASLPRVFGTTLATVPAEVPYLKPQGLRVKAWAERLGPARGLRVALAWAGSPGHIHDASRSIPLRSLLPLAAIAGIEWYSVQKGPGAEQVAAVSDAGWKIGELGSALADLADTAAVLSQMDLVITVDTSVAHLAGAMGARTWTLLAHPPEWRWLMDRRDTPWYPTMTLFRQREVDQWGPVVARVRHRLERLARSKGYVGP